ncbi:MAG: hypothetical protein J7463_15715 [Roseiflexus sp.]|nr:hypothetical protein [Roseiflexus sp.]MBO9334244.1 hypothetical protein [Roseiflexus sp.]MBO9364624.1 hypothetical protein [Roseiflexus sp.]MBO9383456.1 hypothetical protein [Roseiflexus sp.]MBO9388466.1 hypothetical protein [Roseiflexus sp.]
MRWPKYISVYTPPEAGASRDAAGPDKGQRENCCKNAARLVLGSTFLQ